MTCRWIVPSSPLMSFDINFGGGIKGEVDSEDEYLKGIAFSDPRGEASKP